MAVIRDYMNGPCRIKVNNGMMCHRTEEKEAIWNRVSVEAVKEAIRQEKERAGEGKKGMGKGPYAG